VLATLRSLLTRSASSLQAGVAACVVASADVDKQADVAALCRAFPGALYACVGALPDNIKRTNDKQMAAWVAAVRELALAPECVAIQTGLNLAREAATHHAQERLLDMHARLAAQLALPLIVHAAPGTLHA
jgi:Tat protein secretion system quality control protein TatD with DNase activity